MAELNDRADRPIKRRVLDRSVVLHAAADLADQHGMETLTLASVAEACGVRVPSLYNHVSSLADLRQGIALIGFHELADQLRRAAVGKASDSAIEVIGWRYRAFVQEHPGVYAVMGRVFEDLERPEYAPRRAEIEAAGAEPVAVVAAVLEGIGFTGDAAIHAIRAFRASLHGFTELERAQGFRLGLDLDESFARLLEMLIQGLHAMQMAH
jgi:AcrR family transcriptional regulator